MLTNLTYIIFNLTQSVLVSNNKTTFQQTTHKPNESSLNIVDGNFRTESRTKLVSPGKSVLSWIDLGDAFDITHVLMYKQTKFTSRRQAIKYLVSNKKPIENEIIDEKVCSSFENRESNWACLSGYKDVSVLNSSCVGRGRFLLIFMTNKDSYQYRFRNLEFQVFAEKLKSIFLKLPFLLLSYIFII